MAIGTVELFTDIANYDPSNATTLFVRGYYRIGDGGGGTFVFVQPSDMPASPPGTPPVPDRGIVVESVNHPTYPEGGYWMRSFSGYIDVRFYGVMGITQDETDRIQEAIDYAARSVIDYLTHPYGSTNSNTVFLPNENYLASKLVMKSGVRLKGASVQNTRINSVDDDNPYLIVLDNSRTEAVIDIQIEDIQFVGNARNAEWNPKTKSLTRAKGCLGFISDRKGCHGLFNSMFRNVLIILFTGDSIRFQGTMELDKFDMPMQFITMENVQAESVGQLAGTIEGFQNDYHALTLLGQCGQFLFTNCRFDGSSYPANPNDPGYYNTTTNILISTDQIITDQGILLPCPAVITFDTCTIQFGQVGFLIDSSHNIKIDSCWFERFERAIIAKGRFFTSRSINILNNSFGFSAGEYGGLPPDSGRVIISENAQLNVHNNYIGDVAQKEMTRYIAVEPEGSKPLSNLGVNSSGNYFEPNPLGPYLGYTSGLKKDVDVTTLLTQTISIQSAKTIYLVNNSHTAATINVIESYSVAGEYLFLRAYQGTVELLETGNLDLLNRGSVKLNNGDVALFVKVDVEISRVNHDISSTYYETYVLIAVLPWI